MANKKQNGSMQQSDPIKQIEKSMSSMKNKEAIRLTKNGIRQIKKATEIEESDD